MASHTLAGVTIDLDSYAAEQAEIDRERGLYDFRRGAFLKLARIPPCIDCDATGSFEDCPGDAPETWFCSCPAGVRALDLEMAEKAWRAGTVRRLAGRAAADAARPTRLFVAAPQPGQPGSVLQATLRRLQRLMASAPYLDRFANGERGESLLRAIQARPFDGPWGEGSCQNPLITPRKPERLYRFARARWIAGEGCIEAFLGSARGIREGDAMGQIANGWIDLAEKTARPSR